MGVERTDRRWSHPRTTRAIALVGKGESIVTKVNKIFKSAPFQFAVWFFPALVVVCMLTLTACQAADNAPESQSSPTKSSVSSPTEDLTAPNPTQKDATTEPIQKDEPKGPEDADLIEAKWQSSKHANSFVVDENGSNSACAQCHAPVNWVPSMDSMPESCYSCKFEIAPPPPLVEESQWKSIECKVCHQVKKKKVQAEIAWLEIPPIEEYAEVDSPTALCLKCHAQTEPLDQHVSIVVAGAHSDMGCNDCHDPHDLSANCASSGCHVEMESASEAIPGHDDAHAMVSCSACHDAEGLEVGPDAEGKWVTFRPHTQTSAGDPIPFTSHNTILDAACERCHFVANPWDLKLLDDVSSP
jgi:hypothetical protein